MDTDAISSLTSGARFFRGDLHIHSFGASHDVTDIAATPVNIVETAIAEGLSLIALADHNEISNVREAFELGSARNLLVVPAVELSTPEGHLLCYAPTPDLLERFFNQLSISERRTNNCRCQTGMAECLNKLRDVNGFAIIAHVELAGAFESNMARLTPGKLDILCHAALGGFEVTKADCPVLYNTKDIDADRKSAASQRNSRLKLGSHQILARVLNSDAHTLTAVGRNARNANRITRYKMESPSYEGLRIALDAADTRVRIEDEIPAAIPILQGIQFSGGFLDGEAIHFSPNLTCIIGGRGSGKSTAFECLRLIGNRCGETASVVDSDVWPDSLSIIYRDETFKAHVLGRSKLSEFENVDDPGTGPIAFAIESYRQGETNDISKQVQNEPLALLTFLDRLVYVDDAVAKEDDIRGQLNTLAPEIKKAALNVAKIPEFERELALKSAQVTRLKTENAEEIIKLQQRLEGEKRARSAVEVYIGQLSGKIENDGLIQITKGIKDSISGGAVEFSGPEAQCIIGDTTAYEAKLSVTEQGLKIITSEYANKVRAQISAWKQRESLTTKEIDEKKAVLLTHGIRLDMLSIQRLVSEEAKAAENVRNLKTWIPELKRLTALHAELLGQRWETRRAVAALRAAFAIRSSNALKGTLSDLFVSLKYELNGLSPDAEDIISDVMSWRTLQQLKAKALITQLTLPMLIRCIKEKISFPISALKNDKGIGIFSQSEIDILLERLGDPDILSRLETVALYDLPRLSVTKRVDVAGSSPQYVPRDFKRLSLGQQQSVLLALMLTSESRAPLIVDQPEDNLDSEFIYKTLIPVIRQSKERRQIIVVTHNANIAVLGDAEQIIALRATNAKSTIMARGSIDEPNTNAAACAILEGSPEAFERRARIYGIGGR